MRMQPIQCATMRPALSAILITPVLLLSACGGDDDTFPKDEFVDMVTANGVTEEVATCTYDAIVDDADIMEDLKRAGGPTNEISSKSAERLSRVIAACLLGLEVDDVDNLGATTTTEAGDPKDRGDATTTTAPERTTTTESDPTTTTARDRDERSTTTTSTDRDGESQRPTTTQGFGTRSGSN